jgi:hypothetical protein
MRNTTKSLGCAALAVILCGCRPSSSSAAASSREAPPTASDWEGVHAIRGPSSPVGADAAQTRGTWVLHVGDSFVDASFSQNLGPRFRAAGARYVALGTTATFTTDWAYDPELDRWLSQHPSLVLVTLGANEVEVPFPKAHAGAVARIARKISAASPACVWTTPPMWKDDTGILQVIHDHCAPCLFFESDALLGNLTDEERQSDHIHPNGRGGARWADTFWAWLEEHRDPSRGPWALVPFERR